MIFGLAQDQIVFIAIMIITIILFITEYLRVDVIAMLIILSLSITGLLDVKEALSGFSSEPAIIVAAVFVLSAGLAHTGVTDIIGEWITKFSGSHETRAIFVIMIAVALMSAFTHHLMVTAMMLPIIMKICKNEKDLHASRLLIPMATAASLGTTLTLIGAPAFLLANSILVRSGEKALGLFTIGKIGLLLVAAGIIFCILMRWILPKVSGEQDSLDKFKLTDITTELIVVENSPWIGKTLEELITQKEKEFSLLSWIRGDAVQDQSQKKALLEAGDNFVISTTPDELVSFDGGQGLQLKALHKFSDGKENFVTLAGEEKRILKAVIAHNSVFIGRTVADMNFYDRFGAAIVGIWRKTGWITTGVADVVLKAGDMLVIWGPMEKLNDLINHRGFLMVLPFFANPKKRNKSTVAIGIMLISIALAATSILPAHIAFLAGAVAMVLTKCVNVEQSYEAIEVKIFVMIAGVIPLGIAMEHTGVDKLLAGQLKNFTGSWQPFAVLMIFYWISALITQILSDSATTILIAPIAVAFAKSAQLSPTAAVVCVTMGAVASFLTPIGHHGNLLILSPGGYKFADFLKIGLPLTLILSIITCYMSLMYM